ncbi:MAG: hypothetical protein IOC59_14515 [Methylobacterium sp.]|nr:hypothetical protein [Methylobacterium sp.]
MSHVLVMRGRNGHLIPLSPVFAPLRRWLSRSVFRIPVPPLGALLLGMMFLAIMFLAIARPARAESYTLSFETYPTSITAGSTVTFQARLAGSEGNPVPFTSVYFSIRDKDGAWAPVRFTDSDGIASLVWDFSPVGNYDCTTNVRAFVFINGSFQSNTLNGPAISIVARERDARAPTGVSASEIPAPSPLATLKHAVAADLGSYRNQFYSTNYNDIREAGTVREAVSANVSDFKRTFEIYHAQQRDLQLSQSVKVKRSAQRP